jgi:replicative DNA helicase
MRDVLQASADLLEEDSNKAVEYLMNKLGTELQPQYKFNDEEIVESTKQRVKDSEYRSQNPTEWFIPTGFSEIDSDINGMQRGEELIVLFARTNMGKSWIAEAMATYVTEQGYRVGYFSPEMSAQSIGYRFDTLHGNVPNSAVLLGRFDDDFTLEQYNEYADGVEKLTGKMYVTKPKDFQRKVTVSKLRNWIQNRKLDLLIVDGIKYLTDERKERGDSVTTSLTNISEDLMELSIELRLPIVVVVQANRGGVVEKNSLDTPDLENIRDSDGIAQNASIVFALRQLKDTAGDTFMIIENKKMRNGAVGKSYKYKWDINRGIFDSVLNIDVPQDEETNNYSKYTTERKEPTTGNKRRKRDVEEEF